VTGYTDPSAGIFNIILARYLSNYEPPPYDTSARDELFGLYPNPTSGAFTVQFGLSHSTTVSLNMYDAQGRFFANPAASASAGGGDLYGAARSG